MKKQVTSRPHFHNAQLLFYLLAIVVFAISVKYAGTLHNINRLITGMQPAYLFLVILLQTATYALSAALFQTLLGTESRRLSSRTLFKTSIVMLFINQTLPSGGISGYSYLFGLLRKRLVPPWKAFSTVLLESLTYYAAFCFSWVCRSVFTIFQSVTLLL